MHDQFDYAIHDFDLTIPKRLRPLIRPGGEIYDPQWDWHCTRQNEIHDKAEALSEVVINERNV